LKKPQIAEFSDFISQNREKYYFAATAATIKNIHTYYSAPYQTP